MSAPVSLAFRIHANIAELRTQMAAAQAQLETTKQAMQRMTAAFDGSKIIADSNAIVKAVTDMGGASKLTEAEQKRVNATLTEALAKYKALGIEAPPGIAAVAAATAKLEPPLSMADKAAGLLKSTFGQFTLASLASAAIQKLATGLMEFASQGTKLPALEQSFRKLTAGIGQDGSAMLQNMSTATRGLVSNYDLLTSANKAILLGLPVTSASMGDLAKTATVLGKAMGQDATKSLDDLITALGRSSPMILDNLGLTVKVGEANEAYAAKMQIVGRELTDAEKKMAFYEAAMEAAARKVAQLGEQTRTFGEIAQSVWVRVGNHVSTGVAIINEEVGASIDNLLKNTFRYAEAVKGHGFIAANAMMQLQKDQATMARLAAEHAGKMYPHPPPAAVAAVKSYRDQLGDAEASVRKLTAAQVSEIAAAQKLGVSTKDLAAQFKVTEVAISLVGDAQKKAVTAGAAHTKAMDDIRLATIPLTAAQMATAVANDKLGVSAEKTAKNLGVSAGRVKDYLESLANGSEIVETWRKFHEKLSDGTTKFVNRYLADTTAMHLKVADASAKALADRYLTSKVYEEKNYQLTLTGTALQLRQIELQRDATIRAHGDMGGQVSKYYQHQVDIATGASSTIVGRMRAAGVATRSDLERTAANARRDYEQMAAQSGVFSDQAIRDQKKIAEAAAHAAAGTKSAWDKTYDALGDVNTILSNVPGLFAEIGAVAARTGQAIMKNLAEGDVWGAVIAAAVGAIEVITKLWSKFFGTAGRDIVEDFAASMGGFDTLQRKLQETFDPEVAHRFWVALTQGVGRNNPEQAKKVVDEINAAFAAQDAWLGRLPGLIEKYGLSWEQAGQKAKQAHLDEIARGLIQDFADLSKAGFDVTLITEKMGTAINDYVNQAMRTGTEIPAAMKPLLQKMIEMGTLTDTAGLKLEDLEGITFATTLTDGFKSVVDAIRELTKALTGELGGALDDLAKRKIRIPVDVDDIPGGKDAAAAATGAFVGMGRLLKFAGGGTVPQFTPQGTDTVPAMLTPGEIVINAAQQKNVADRIQGGNNVVDMSEIRELRRDMKNLMRDQPRAIAVAVADTLALTLRRR